MSSIPTNRPLLQTMDTATISHTAVARKPFIRKVSAESHQQQFDKIVVNDSQLMNMAFILGWDCQGDFAGLTNASRPHPSQTLEQGWPLERDLIRINKFCDTGACEMDLDGDGSHFYLKEIYYTNDYETDERIVTIVATRNTQDFDSNDIVVKKRKLTSAENPWQIYIERDVDVFEYCRDHSAPQTIATLYTKLTGETPEVAKLDSHDDMVFNLFRASMLNVFDHRNPPTSVALQRLSTIQTPGEHRTFLSFLVEDGIVDLVALDQLLHCLKPNDMDVRAHLDTRTVHGFATLVVNQLFRDDENDVGNLRILGERPDVPTIRKSGQHHPKNLREIADEKSDAFLDLDPYNQSITRSEKDHHAIQVALNDANTARNDYMYMRNNALHWGLKYRTLLDFAMQHHPDYKALHVVLQRHGGRTSRELVWHQVQSKLQSEKVDVAAITDDLLLNPHMSFESLSEVCSNQVSLDSARAKGRTFRDAVYAWVFDGQPMPKHMQAHSPSAVNHRRVEDAMLHSALLSQSPELVKKLNVLHDLSLMSMPDRAMA